MKNDKQFSSEMADRMAIKNSVDTFSILADQKETQKQTLLFTEDAIVESISQGRPGTILMKKTNRRCLCCFSQSIRYSLSH